MNNHPIQEVDSHKHFGQAFSNDGTWHEHLKFITAKEWTRINVMRKFIYKLDRKALEIIYFSFNRPILVYANIILGNCSQYEQNEIQKVQIEAGRIVSALMSYFQ